MPCPTTQPDLYRHIPVLLLTALVSVLPAANAADLVLQGDTSCTWGSPDCNRCVNDVPANFDAIASSYKGSHGSRMTLRSYAYPAKDALLHRIGAWNEHVQGLGRIAGLVNAEYLVFTHSTNSSESGKSGALAVVRMGANQGSRGFALGDLRGRDGADQRRQNRTVARTFTDSNHPGGLATLGHHVFVADWCQPHGNSGWCDRPPQAWAIEVYDLGQVHRNAQRINAHRPERIVDQSVHVAGDPLRSRSTSTIAATRLADGRYLVALGRSGGQNYEYFISNDDRLSRRSHWASLGDVSPIEKWGEGAAMVNECGSGDVYLIQIEKWRNSQDQLHLFRLEQAGTGAAIAHRYLKSRTLRCSDGTPWRDFDKGAGIYVAPAGNLYLYASDAQPAPDSGRLRLVEFGNTREPAAAGGRDGSNTADHRRPDAQPPRRNEVVPSRRGQLPAPSELTLSEVGRTSLRLNWMDNARSEHGVSVERGLPTADRGGTNHHWRHVFNVEERVMSRVRATGWRSDLDDQLRPGTEYCYRLRSYQKAAFSAYSASVCAQTAP